MYCLEYWNNTNIQTLQNSQHSIFIAVTTTLKNQALIYLGSEKNELKQNNKKKAPFLQATLKPNHAS